MEQRLLPNLGRQTKELCRGSGKEGMKAVLGIGNESEIGGPERADVATVLVVDDEDSALRLCADVARDAGLRVRTATTTEQALQILDEFPIDIVITDLRVPELGGLELLRRIREHYPAAAVLVLTQYGTIQSAVEATKLGAADYVTKPFHIDELRRKIQRLVHEQELDHENRVLREQLRTRPGYKELTGTSPKMQRVYKLIERVSQHNYPVLILGESGTGKELVARSIHFSGPRSNKLFVPVDCSALAPTLIESELFGYVKGAFTGAVHSKQGVFESADGGTLFLDEIGNLPVDMQAKLLRVIQEREVKPVGSNERVHVNVRVIAATNRDLEAAVRQGSFRQDLFFRLNVVQVKVPPLRDRKSDIPLLVQVFLDKFVDPGGAIPALAEDAMARLTVYDWPGNIRELENAIQRAVALGSGPILHSGDLPSNLQNGTAGVDAAGSEDEKIRSLDEMERRAIFRALQEASGDKMIAARLLGIGKTTLYRKLKQYRMQMHEEPIR